MQTTSDRVRLGRRRVVAVLLALAGATLSAQTTPRKAPQVLFVCPHGAGKSVLASAYFQRLAKEKGLNVRVEARGTEPDPRRQPEGRRAPDEERLPASRWRPRRR